MTTVRINKWGEASKIFSICRIIPQRWVISQKDVYGRKIFVKDWRR